MNSAAFSVTIMVGKLVLALGTQGMTEASTTRPPPPLEADDTAMRIDHRIGILGPPHATGARDMPHRCDRAARPLPWTRIESWTFA